MSAAASVLMMRSFSKMFLRARRALEFLRGQDPTRTLASISYCSRETGFSPYQSARLNRYDAAT